MSGRLILDLKVCELREELEKRHLPTSGKKHELVNRLKNIMKSDYLSVTIKNDSVIAGNLNNSFSSDASDVTVVHGVKARKESKSNRINLLMCRRLQRLEQQLNFLVKENMKLRHLMNHSLKINKQNSNTERFNVSKKNCVKSVDVSNANLIDSAIPKIESNIRSNNVGCNLSLIDKINPNKSMVQTSSTPGIKGKILLVALSHGRGLAKELRKRNSVCGRNVVTLFKPNACIEGVVENLVSLTSGFSSDDYVIVLGGTNNAPRGAGVNRYK